MIAAASTVPWWVALLTPAVALAGVVLGWAGDFWLDKRRSERDLTKWHAEFQRTNLLDLQNAVTLVSEKCQRVFNEKQLTFNETGQWPARVEASAEEGPARFAALKLAERVDDANLREAVLNLGLIAAQVLIAGDSEKAGSALMALVEAYFDLNQQIGVALRAVLAPANSRTR